MTSDHASCRVKAVLGPTNTGKTHLAIERMCAHSSGAIGFPLRLLAREVYDRVCAIKGESRVALITGEERIEPRDARWLLCTAEAMPVSTDLAFVALDEAQLGADRERGHIFTDRLLHARGREETMILGSSSLEPILKKLLPEAEVIGRPRFSTLSYAGVSKLSRVPPRSAIVAFSAEQVYAIAEMLRRFRGGAAVVMGALSPQTRNKQVELYQSGEVDYLVATDAIGMGLNLDVSHVAFAGLSKFDGLRQRRLTPSEMAQIAGRAGRHQKDGTFGTLTGGDGRAAQFGDEEIHAIETHRFTPLTSLYWREAEPRCDSLATLIADLEAPPTEEGLIPAPEAIDLAVLKRLAEDAEITATLTEPAQVARFWAVCTLPDFRQQGADMHARFVARLWQDLRGGELAGDFIAASIAQLDNVSGDIDTLQGRIASIRSWAYIAQRPDWVRAHHEMAARARDVEARLSDALHARLTERFVNRRTAVLLKATGADPSLLSVRLDEDDVLVEGHPIGRLEGLRFVVDPQAGHADRKLLLAAAERHVPALLEQRALALVGAIGEGAAELSLEKSAIVWKGQGLALLSPGRSLLEPRLTLDPSLAALSPSLREKLAEALTRWLAARMTPLEPLRDLEQASRDAEAGPELRALLIRLVESGGVLARVQSGVERLDPGQRRALTKLGIRIGALDIFVPTMLKPGAVASWAELDAIPGQHRPTVPVEPAMPATLSGSDRRIAFGYRRAGRQALRVDLAEKLLRHAHAARVARNGRKFIIEPALAVSMGLRPASFAQLLNVAGFRPILPRPLAEQAQGPPAPTRWRWRPPHRRIDPASTPRAEPGNAFSALAELVR